MVRNRNRFSGENQVLVMRIVRVLDNLVDYWPLTLRQVYYQLVTENVIENNISQYKKLSNLLTRARLAGDCPWEAIEDRTREVLHGGGWANPTEFITHETENYLEGYKRDLLQDQEVNLEIWVEKDALSRICHRAAEPYCVPVVVAKGYASISFVRECRDRILREAKHNKRATIMLYFGDLDPSGWNMLPVMMETLQDEMSLGELVGDIRCALNMEQVDAIGLPHNPDALKWTDSRAAAYVRQFGEVAVELDAVPPDTLIKMIENSIEHVIDMDLFNKQKEIEIDDIKEILKMKESVQEKIDEMED